MSKVQRRNTTLSGLIDSDSEDDHFVASMPTPDSGAENQKPGRKRRVDSKVAPMKVTKSKAPARRLSGRLNTKTKAPAAQKKGTRKALADKTNEQYMSETEEVDEFAKEDVVMEIEDTIIEPRATKAKATRKNATKKIEKPVQNDSKVAKPKGRPGRKKAAPKEPIIEELSPEKVVMETQPSMMDLDEDSTEIVEEPIARTAHNASSARSSSQLRKPAVQSRRAGSASDTERGDPNLRRKLSDMTNKYDSLHIKYQDLREIGIKEAERNYDQLKIESQEKEKIFNKLIASLNSDMAKQTALARESKDLKKKLDSKSNEAITLQAQVAQLTASLAETKTTLKALESDKKSLVVDYKILNAKLNADRAAATAIESATAPKVPGSAVKPTGSIRLMGSVETAQAAQIAQLKEDLFSDLTGLIIRSVKREKDEDIFDCIQTGRYGTLHFKLDISTDSSEEAQCNYVPLLDHSRDKDMIELLPDYLIDEITFPRTQAARFYARVVKALTEKAA